MTKSEFLAQVRRKLYEDTADLWEDTDLYAFADEELRTLPRKNIYNEEIWKLSTEIDKDEYQLPTGTYKVDIVKNDEAYPSTPPNWVKQEGWTVYAGKLFLDLPADRVEPMRIYIRKSFTPITSLAVGDTINMGDDQLEVLVLGTVVRAYSALMGYFVDLKNWDYNAKPDGISMNQVQNWITTLKAEYMDAIRYAKKSPQPRDIDLTA